MFMVTRRKLWKLEQCFGKLRLWIFFKCNIDGAARGARDLIACSSIFHDGTSEYIGVFASFIGVAVALQAKLMGAIICIEIEFVRGWTFLWLECDFTLVIVAFKNTSVVSWSIRVDGIVVLLCAELSTFMVSNIFREGNKCVELKILKFMRDLNWNLIKPNNYNFPQMLDALNYRFSTWKTENWIFFFFSKLT